MRRRLRALADPRRFEERAFRLLARPVGKGVARYASWVVGASRVEVGGPGAPTSGPAVYVIWHRDLPVMMAHHGERRRWMMMSAAPKMQPIAVLAESLGLRLVRGATGERGREALRQLEEVIARGESVLLAVDGPAGPPLVVKPGCVWLARATGAPIIATGYRSQRSLTAPLRWDRLRLHLPFDSFRIVYGGPVAVGREESDEAALARVTAALEETAG